MTDRLSLRPTFADIVAVALILWSAGYSVVMINSAGSEAVFAQTLLVAFALLALRGMYLLKTGATSVVL
jgi:hypothetical protein